MGAYEILRRYSSDCQPPKDTSRSHLVSWGGTRPLSFMPIREPATSPSAPANHELGPTGTLQTDPILEVLPRARSVSVLASCHAHVERNLCNAHDHTMYTPAPLTARRHGPRVRHVLFSAFSTLAPLCRLGCRMSAGVRYVMTSTRPTCCARGWA